MSKLFGVVGIIALVVALIIAGPLLLIWALNTLFPVVAIPYTIWTWLAAFVLGATVSPTVKIRR
jgi:hypothetical protein